MVAFITLVIIFYFGIFRDRPNRTYGDLTQLHIYLTYLGYQQRLHRRSGTIHTLYCALAPEHAILPSLGNPPGSLVHCTSPYKIRDALSTDPLLLQTWTQNMELLIAAYSSKIERQHLLHWDKFCCSPSTLRSLE